MVSALTAVIPPKLLVTLRASSSNGVDIIARLRRPQAGGRQPQPAPSQFAPAEQSLGTEDHQQDEQQGIQDHAQAGKLLIERSQRFRQNRQGRGAEDGAR